MLISHTDLSWFNVPLYLLLFLWALQDAKRVAHRHYQLQLSDDGDLKIRDEQGIAWVGKIKTSSYYNRFFLVLHLQPNKHLLQKRTSYSILIYRDALSPPEYHLLARLINSEHQV